MHRYEFPYVPCRGAVDFRFLINRFSRQVHIGLAKRTPVAISDWGNARRHTDVCAGAP